MRGGFVSRFLGWGLGAFAALLLLFTLYALLAGDPWHGFAVAAALAAAGAALLASARVRAEPGHRDIIALVLLVWLVFPLLGAIPLWLSGPYTAFDALFESLSGFTTAGLSVLGDATLPASLALFRASTQWLGAAAIMVVFVAVFPQLGVAGRQLFAADLPGPGQERLLPRLRQAAPALLSAYLVLTLLCALGYWLVGMSGFDALAYALGTVSTGGFGASPGFPLPPGAALAGFVAILFMFLAGTSHVLHYRAMGGRPRVLLRDTEFRTYAAMAALAGLLLALLLLPAAPLDALHHGFFQALSALTTTGFILDGVEEWRGAAQMLLPALMLVGASAATAAGGIGIVRLTVAARSAGHELRRMLHPRAALPLHSGGRQLSAFALRAVMTFIVLHLSLIGISTVLLGLLGLDPATSLGSAVAAVTLTGFAFGPEGALVDFASLPAAGRAVLMLGMYAGRLEIMVVALLALPDWWRLPRRRGRP